MENNIVHFILKQPNATNSDSIFRDFFKGIMVTGDFIESLKCMSITPSMFESMCCRKYIPLPSESELNQFIRENHLNKFSAMVLRKKIAHLLKNDKNYGAMAGNIMEALRSEEDFVNKMTFLPLTLRKKNSLQSIDNVKAGLALIVYLEKYKNDYPPVEFEEKSFLLQGYAQSDSSFWNDLYAYTTQKNRIRTWKILSKAWVNLYIAWNSAFILRRGPEKFHLFLPKLFIPSVLLSSPEDFVSVRIISLWLTMNFTNSLRVNRIETQYKAHKLEPFLTIFGKNNFLYAQNELFKINIDLEALYEKRIQDRSSIANYMEAINLISS
jgi:hypothetical protein